MNTISTPHLQKRITITDVAREAGVALTTVSSAFHGRGRVSSTQKDRILKIAKELGYRPKMAAQMLRSNSTGHIGIILSGANASTISESGHSGPILTNFIRSCEQRGLPYHVEFFDFEGDFEPPKQLAGGLMDGVIVGGYLGPQLGQWLEKNQHQWVSVDEPANYCALSADDEGMYQAAQRLAALGHRRIAYLGGTKKYRTQRVSLNGFMRAVKDFSLEISDPRWITEIEASDRRSLLSESYEWSSSIFAAEHRPTAILSHGIVLARGCAYRAMQAGLRIPEDLSIIAVSMSSDAEKALPCMSTLEVDFHELVEQSMNMLLRRLDGTLKEPQTHYVVPHLVMRDTVAAAPPK